MDGNQAANHRESTTQYLDPDACLFNESVEAAVGVDSGLATQSAQPESISGGVGDRSVSYAQSGLEYTLSTTDSNDSLNASVEIASSPARRRYLDGVEGQNTGGHLQALHQFEDQDSEGDHRHQSRSEDENSEDENSEDENSEDNYQDLGGTENESSGQNQQDVSGFQDYVVEENSHHLSQSEDQNSEDSQSLSGASVCDPDEHRQGQSDRSESVEENLHHLHSQNETSEEGGQRLHTEIPAQSPRSPSPEIQYPSGAEARRYLSRLTENNPSEQVGEFYCNHPQCSMRPHICYPAYTLTSYGYFLGCSGFDFNDDGQPPNPENVDVASNVDRDVSRWSDSSSSSDGSLDDDGSGAFESATEGTVLGAGLRERVVRFADTAVVIEDLPGGYDADSEDGGNGYESRCDDDDDGNEINDEDEDSDDIARPYKRARC